MCVDGSARTFGAPLSRGCHISVLSGSENGSERVGRSRRAITVRILGRYNPWAILLPFGVADLPRLITRKC